MSPPLLSFDRPPTVTCALVLALTAAGAASAQPYLVRDLATASSPPNPYIREMLSLEDLAILFVGRGDLVPWRLDGTFGGTYPLAEQGGTCGHRVAAVTLNGRLFYTSTSLNEPYELCVSDGTLGGTRVIFEVPGGADPAPFPHERVLEAIPELDKVFLWYWHEGATELRAASSRDPTFDLLRTFPSTIGHFAATPESLFFTAEDPAGTLWKSDGTAAGTVPIPGAPEEMSWELVASGDLVFFPARNEGRRELWRTDGSELGTFRVSSDSPGRVAPALGGALFVVGSGFGLHDVWFTDGRPSSARPIGHFTYVLGESLPLSYVSEVHGRALFFANDGSTGLEPWYTDGTAEGTGLLVDLCPGPCSSDPSFVGAANGRQYLTGRNPDVGQELWVTDGTPAGTHLIFDLCPGPCPSYPFYLVEQGHRAVFHARLPETGNELWETRGTPEKPIRLTDWQEPASLRRLALLADGSLAIVAEDADVGLAAWRLGPSASRVELVRPLGERVPYGPGLSDVREQAGQLVFVAERSDDRVLWRSDGTRDGTRPIEGLGGAELGQLLESHDTDRLYFMATDPTHGRELWATDPGLAGAARVTDEGAPTAGFSAVGSLDPWFLFTTGGDLWKTTGIMSSSALVQESVDASGPGAKLGSGLLFPGKPNLWQTDGTAPGTSIVAGEFHNLRNFVRLGDEVFFSGSSYSSASGIWRTDGTTTGTTLFHEMSAPDEFSVWDQALLVPEPDGLHRLDPIDGSYSLVYSYVPGEILLERAIVGERIFFFSVSGYDKVLRVFDGSTNRLSEILRVEGYDGLGWLTPVGGELAFTALDLGHGVELWRSDGTVAGTRLAFDIVPGSQSSDPYELRVAGDRLFLEASAPGVGKGLWAVSIADFLSATGRPIQPQMRLDKTVSESSDLRLGGVVTYLLTLTNEGPLSVPDLPGDEVRDVLPSSLELADAYSEAGLVRAIRSENTVTWNGAVASGQTILITIDAVIRNEGVIENQGELFLDLDGDDLRDATQLSQGPEGGATVLAVGTAVAIPTLATAGLLLLTAAILLTAFLLLSGRCVPS